MNTTLVVDVGNTEIVFGLYREDKLACRWRLSSTQTRTTDELAMQLHGMLTLHSISNIRLTGIMAASVVPAVDTVLSLACHHVFGCTPIFVGVDNVKTGMAVDYKNPKEVGADRIVNAVAARARFGSPVIVMDCGTATTFDIVSPEGHYAGGLIIPGMGLALEALSRRAARLPQVRPSRTEALIARDTVTSMQAGSYWATVDGLTGIIRRLHAISGYGEAPVIASGGLAGDIIHDIPGISACRPNLTLEGLKVLADQHFS